jgi:hypothetical protein
MFPNHSIVEVQSELYKKISIVFFSDTFEYISSFKINDVEYCSSYLPTEDIDIWLRDIARNIPFISYECLYTVVHKCIASKVIMPIEDYKDKLNTFEIDQFKHMKEIEKKVEKEYKIKLMNEIKKLTLIMEHETIIAKTKSINKYKKDVCSLKKQFQKSLYIRYIISKYTFNHLAENISDYIGVGKK